MPWCLLKSSMVSLNNLCVLHGPAGWGEYSGSAETLWAPVVPPPCWRMGVYAPRAGTASDHFPTSTSSTGRWGEPREAPQHFTVSRGGVAAHRWLRAHMVMRHHLGMSVSTADMIIALSGTQSLLETAHWAPDASLCLNICIPPSWVLNLTRLRN